jgi:hypothetical protein
MLTPTFDYLKSISLNSGMPKSYAFGSRMHRNPRLYKYLWRIFWEGSLSEGDAFLRSTPLPTKAAFDLMHRLNAEGKPYFCYCSRQRRLGIAIWDYSSPKILRDGEFAPSYDDDIEPPTECGHK